MFPKAFLESFRHYEDREDFVVDPAVREAWQSFTTEFCRSVSYHWKHYLLKIGKRENATFEGNLSTSDEVFAMWVIHCKYEDAQAEAEEIKSIGLAKWKDSRTRRRSGPHDSKANIEDYCRLYKLVQERRRDQKSSQYWQDMFFDDYFDNPENQGGLQDGNARSTEISNQDSGGFALPGVDDDVFQMTEKTSTG